MKECDTSYSQHHLQTARELEDVHLIFHSSGYDYTWVINEPLIHRTNIACKVLSGYWPLNQADYTSNGDYNIQVSQQMLLYAKYFYLTHEWGS